ncbi:MAG: winged helix family transcriptional regulator, partial [Candidatus Thioglobus sp.]
VLTEFRLLQFFMTHADFVYSRQHILDRVWGEDRFLDGRTVNTYVRRLRNKLEAASADVEFVSVRGVGYMFL